MKRMRLHILIAIAIALVLFVIGSFVDLKLNEAIFSRNNAFGLTVSILGAAIGCSTIAFFGGGLISQYNNKNCVKWQRIVFLVLGFVAIAATTYFVGKEFFGENGFYNKKLYYLGFPIGFAIACGFAYLGFWCIKNSERKDAWLIIGIVLIGIFLALVPGVTVIKIIFHRPRYRSISLYEAVTFHNWWQRCTNYKELINMYEPLTSEEFKSFPSGHSGYITCTLFIAVFLPLLNEKTKKFQIPAFYVGLLLYALVAFSRMLVGAHFLSDVSMGMLLILIFVMIANEVVIALDKRKEKAEVATE